MDLAAVMDEIAARLGTIVRSFGFPPDSLVPPAAVVGYPDTFTFDETYGRGLDRLTLPVWLVVGKVVEKSTRDKLAAYVDGSGSSSVKQVIESGIYTTFHTVRVVGVEFDVVSIAGTDYMTAKFDLDIAGAGSS